MIIETIIICKLIQIVVTVYSPCPKCKRSYTHVLKVTNEVRVNDGHPQPLLHKALPDAGDRDNIELLER